MPGVSLRVERSTERPAPKVLWARLEAAAPWTENVRVLFVRICGELAYIMAIADLWNFSSCLRAPQSHAVQDGARSGAVTPPRDDLGRVRRSLRCCSTGKKSKSVIWSKRSIICARLRVKRIFFSDWFHRSAGWNVRWSENERTCGTEGSTTFLRDAWPQQHLNNLRSVASHGVQLAPRAFCANSSYSNGSQVRQRQLLCAYRYN